jgi:hypothetical protein
MEDSRCKVAAAEPEDLRCKSLLQGVEVEMEDPRCKYLGYSRVIEMDDPRCQISAMKMDDPRCQRLHIW